MKTELFVHVTIKDGLDFANKNLFIAIFGYFIMHEHCFAIILPLYCNTKVGINFAQISESAFLCFLLASWGVCVSRFLARQGCAYGTRNTYDSQE